MPKRLTIYVLTYNRPDYLAQCLDSIRAQRFKDFGILVLDNASDKDYGPVLKQYRDLDLEYVRHEQNMGSSGNFKYAWSMPTESPYMMIFHDDDLMHPNLLAEEVALLEADSGLMWVASGSTPFKGTPPPFAEFSQIEKHIFDCPGLADALIRKGDILTFSSVMYRTWGRNLINLDSLVQRCSIIGDRPLLLELAEAGRCALLYAPLVLYRNHPAQDSRTGPLNEDNVIELFVSYKSALRNNWTSQTQHLFYSCTGFALPGSFFRISPAKRSALPAFLKKAQAQGIFRFSYLSRYPIGLIGRQFSRACRIPAKIQEWRRNRSMNSKESFHLI
jgi:glycosyltransferase involved in cell wall biosynthesis